MLKMLVLDEADKLLDMDFEKEIDQILSVIPRERRTLLFSATMTTKVQKLQRASLRSPVKARSSICCAGPVLRSCAGCSRVTLLLPVHHRVHKHMFRPTVRHSPLDENSSTWTCTSVGTRLTVSGICRLRWQQSTRQSRRCGSSTSSAHRSSKTRTCSLRSTSCRAARPSCSCARATRAGS